MKPAYCGIQGAGVAQFSVNHNVRVNLSIKRISEEISYEESSGTDIAEWENVSIAISETGLEENSMNKISSLTGRKRLKPKRGAGCLFVVSGKWLNIFAV